MKVKICGVKSVQDALTCINLGADAIGLLVGQMHSSNDFISKETAKEIVESLPPFCNSVLVTHLLSANEIVELAKYIGVNTIQLHSDIQETEVETIKKELPNVKLLRLIHVSVDGEIYSDYQSMKIADAFLLDSFNLSTNQVGGTGLTHDWSADNKIKQILNKPIVVAGGLNPSNVKQAILQSHPFAVDVNSGVKGENGFKDYEKVKQFIANAKFHN